MTGAGVWSDAVTSARLFAVDPQGLGGVWLRSRVGPVRERWLAALRAALGPSCSVRHLPLGISDGRLLGGLDLNATLVAGRPVAERGLLSEADGGVIILAMAERVSATTISHITSAMDSGQAVVEREGLSLRHPARFGVVALDEGLEDEFAPASLRDRLALHLDLNAISRGDAEEFPIDSEETAAARLRLPSVQSGPDQIEALCTAATALGITSLRAPLFAVRVARASAALAGRSSIEQDDLALAARLVLAPRALAFPSSDETRPPEQPPQPSENEKDESGSEQAIDVDRALDEVVLAAARAAIPADVLAALRSGSAPRQRSRAAGKAGAMQKSSKRGRPAGVRRGDPRSSGKLNLIETLRAAAPWQGLRRRDALAQSKDVRPHILIRKDDFRISRFRQRTETVTVFVVDASGSAALHRLAEAKGAVELLLADCYIRRDQVALISFRGQAAELLLPPTRSLARAKRSLAGLPGGGGTPLAAGLDAAFVLSDAVRRKGQTPTVIVLTDGRANIARDGGQGRPRAEQDATSAAKQLKAAGVSAVLVDTSPRPSAAGEALARDMGARYLPLPYADAVALSKAVLSVVN